MAKKDDGTAENSDDDEKKKKEEEEEPEEEELDEDDAEEVCIKYNTFISSAVAFTDNSFCPRQDNDYNDNYFDNGEDFAADSDDNMDGEATYW